VVFTLKVRYDLNCVKSAVKLQQPTLLTPVGSSTITFVFVIIENKVQIHHLHYSQCLVLVSNSPAEARNGVKVGADCLVYQVLKSPEFSFLDLSGNPVYYSLLELIHPNFNY